MKIKIFLSFLLIISFGIPQIFAQITPPRSASAEDLFWQGHATVHDYENPWDIHSMGASALAFSEYEIFRLVDGMLDLPVPGRFRIFEPTFHFLENTYAHVPNIRPVRRVGQLLDALQIPEISLSDARTVFTWVLDGPNSSLTPIMQVRAQKMIILVEDVVNDVDELLMLPFNYTWALFSEDAGRIRTVGYAADGIGFVRRTFFRGLRAVNKAIVHVTSRGLQGIEATMNFAIRKKRERENRAHLIYVRIPVDKASDFDDFLSGIKIKASRIISEPATAERNYFGVEPEVQVEGTPVRVDLLRQDVSDKSFTYLILAIEAGEFKGAPIALRKFVVTPDEIGAESVRVQMSAGAVSH